MTSFSRSITETALTDNPPSDGLVRIYGGKRIINGGVTFYDDFSEYHGQQGYADATWVTTNTGAFRVNVTNDNLAFFNVANSLFAIAYDLTSVSDSTWNLRFRIRWSINSAAGANNYILLGVSSIAGTPNTTQDSIHIRIDQEAATRTFVVMGSDNQTMFGGTLGNSINQLFATNTDYFVELKRTSTTSCSVEVFTDSSYSNSLGLSTVTIGSTIQSLRYIHFTNVTNSSSNQTGIIDEIQFTNGSTTPLIMFSDSVVRGTTAFRVETETSLTNTPPIDSISRSSVAGRTIGETPYSLVDSLSRIFASFRTVSESLSFTDTVINYFRRKIRRVIRILR